MTESSVVFYDGFIQEMGKEQTDFVKKEGYLTREGKSCVFCVFFMFSTSDNLIKYLCNYNFQWR